MKFSVTFNVHPRPGQSKQEAETEMAELFKDYLTLPEGVFHSDYGLDWKDEYSQGGYKGPFVSEVTVTREER